MNKYIVNEKFKDAPGYAGGKEPKVYEKGDDVSSFDKERLISLVSRGLVKEVEVKPKTETKK